MITLYIEIFASLVVFCTNRCNALFSRLPQFRFADKTDVFLMLFGTLMASCNGAAMPVAMIIFGGMTDVFIDDGWLDNQLEAMAEAAKALCYNLTELCDMNITAACNPPLFPDDCENVTSDLIKDNLWLVECYVQKVN